MSDKEETTTTNEKQEESTSDDEGVNVVIPATGGVKVAGQIFFKPIEARGLKGGKKLVTYAKVYLDKQKKFKTDKIKGTKDPSYNAEPRLLALQADKEVNLVTFAIWRKDMMSSNFLGNFSFQVKDLLDGVPRDCWFKLKNKKGKVDNRGEIHLQVCFLEPGDQMTKELKEFPFPLHTLLRKGKKKIFQNAYKAIKNNSLADIGTNAVDVNFNTADGEGKTIAHVAAELGEYSILQMLIDETVDLDKVDKADRSILHWAAYSGNTDCLDALIKAGADLNVTDEANKTAVHIAAERNKAKAIAVLAEASADLGMQDEDGSTPMHVALANASIEAIHALGKYKADIYKKNNKGLSAAEYSYTAIDDVEENTQKEFFKAVNVFTRREFSLKQKYKLKKVVENTDIGKEWKKSPQYSVTAPVGTTVEILMHYDDPIGTIENPMEKIGFLVLKTKKSPKKEMSYLGVIHSYGKKDPTKITIIEEDEGWEYIFVPYVKNNAIKGKWYFVAYTDQEEFQFTERKDWETILEQNGEWKEKTAGGCVEHKTFFDNPQFLLTIPEEEDVLVNLVLEQAKSEVDLREFHVLPYESHIGYYIYSKDVTEEIGQVKRFKNAREVTDLFHLNGKERREYTIIPCTHKQNEETTFNLFVYSSAECTLVKKTGFTS